MPEAAPSHFLQDLAIVLSVAGLTTVVFQRLKLPIIAGYLIAGVVVGPQVGPQLITDPATIRTLAELGVVLLMTSVGLEFRVRRVLRLGPRVGLAVLIEGGLMLSVGYGLGRLLGWGETDALLAAGVVAISSTVVIAKVFEHRPPDWRVKDLVFGILVLEDVIAIILVALATTIVFGSEATLATLGSLLGRLVLVLAVLIVVGLLVVPPVIRAVVRMERSETTLVTAVGLSFLVAFLTNAAGYSVALGAFAAGTLMAEAGVGHQVGEVIRPVRDLFGAVFFIAVGMLLDVGAAVESAGLVLLFAAVVILGKTVGVSLGAFLSGFGTRLSVQAGLSMSQIGEFSFIIAGLGLARATADAAPLYSVAVATALITALATSWLVGRSERVAAWVDRRLPAPLQTFTTLYGAWLEDLAARRGVDGPWRRARRLLWLLAFDTVIVGAALIGTSLAYRTTPERLASFGLDSDLGRLTILGLGAAVALPFGFGLVLASRRLARELADAVVPPVAVGKVDQGRAPRRSLVVSLEIAIAIGVGLPLVVATLPFLPPFGAPGVIAAVLALLGVAFWRTARDLDSHTRAGAELVAHVLARQGRADGDLAVVRGMLPGLGELSSARVEAGSEAEGKTLGGLNLRGLTGATVVALTRRGERLAYPDAGERLEAGDLIAITGTHQAISQAEALTRATDTSSPPIDTAATARHVAGAPPGSADAASRRPADTPS
jgi:CPA2 family monovalent cation:H+ antiporter-2